MMIKQPLIIAHRVNTIKQLKQTPHEYGVEIDLRDTNGRIIVQHEPFSKGPTLEEYLKVYNHRFLVLNVKSAGLEEIILRTVLHRGLKDFFFLDLPCPAVINLIRQGERRIALRYSEFEPGAACLALKGKVRWIWVDCFNRYPAADAGYKKLLKFFNICLVAPELQGRKPAGAALAQSLMRQYRPTAVCTKTQQNWIR